MVYLLGVSSAFFYGLASVLQHQEAAAAPQETHMRLGLLTHLVRRPMWAAGIAADAAAFVLQAWALSRGPLVLVQPLLTAGLLFALGIAAVSAWRRITRWEWIGSLALVGGLTVLLAAEAPSEGSLVVPFHRWIAATAMVAVACLLLVGWAHRSGGKQRPVLLAIASGITFAMTNAVLKSAVDELSTRGVVEVLDGWYPYALIVVGLLGLLLVQSAFQSGPLELSLPALTVVEPVASTAVGLVLFRESIRADPGALVFEAVAGAMVVFGVWVLGRSPAVTGSAAHTAGDSLPPRNRAETPT